MQKTLTVRTDKRDLAILDAYAETQDLNQSQVIRKFIRGLFKELPENVQKQIGER